MTEHITLEDARELAEFERKRLLYRVMWTAPVLPSVWITELNARSWSCLAIARTSDLLRRNMELEARLKALEEQLKGGGE